jgi:hypothetical protein
MAEKPLGGRSRGWHRFASASEIGDILTPCHVGHKDNFTFWSDLREPRLAVNATVKCERDPALDLGFEAWVIARKSVQQFLEIAGLDFDLRLPIGKSAQ